MEHNTGTDLMGVVELRNKPCAGQLTSKVLRYDFEVSWPAPIDAGCVAVLRVRITGDAQTATLGMSLTDYALARLSREATDRQIKEALSDDAPIAPAELDL